MRPRCESTKSLRQAKLGRIATRSAIAEARGAATHAKQVEALRKCNASELPSVRNVNTARARDSSSETLDASRGARGLLILNANC